MPAPSATAPSTEANTPTFAYFYERTQRRFALADFIKPSGENVPEQIIAMSPLIVREVAEPYADQHFGTPIESDGRAAAPSANPPSVIYYFEDAATIGGVGRNRLTFVWGFDKKRGVDYRLMHRQGFRMTLDDKGYALFWEVLDSRSPRIVYVAQSVEDAAASEFGPPESPRHFSIERPLAEAPETIVPRILSDGPQPMGPFIYIDANKHEVTTLLCRCMPSQVEDFRNNQYFDLRPLPADEPNNRQLLRFHKLLQRADEMPLDQVLRIPSAFSVVP